MATGRGIEVGTIQWLDLRVAEAPKVRDFYRDVVGWSTSDVDMGGSNDFCMNAPVGGQTVAGICHARDENAGLPSQWLVYRNVADLEASMATCVERGGKLLGKVRNIKGSGRYCVIQDPAGAVAAIFEPAP